MHLTTKFNTDVFMEQIVSWTVPEDTVSTNVYTSSF